MLKIFPSINSSLLDELKAEAIAAADEIEAECIDLADTITQWQANKLKQQEQKRRRSDDP